MTTYNNEEELLTYTEVAQILKVKPKTVMNWKSLGRFHPSEYVKYGKSKSADIRFKKSAIEARIKKNFF